MTLTNSTIAANSQGGIYVDGAALRVINSTIALNDAGLIVANVGGLVKLDNSIVALNATDIGLANGGAVDTASAYNLIGTAGSGGLVNVVNGNQVGVADPGLDPTGCSNGGPTATIALVPGSPAIDAGSNALAVDPRATPHHRSARYRALRGSSTARWMSVPTNFKATSLASPSVGAPRPPRSRPPATGCDCCRPAATPTCPGWESTRCQITLAQASIAGRRRRHSHRRDRRQLRPGHGLRFGDQLHDHLRSADHQG